MSLFTPNTNFYNNFFDKERYILGYRISFIFTLLFAYLFISTYFFSFKNDPILTPYFITILIGATCFIYVLKTKNFIILFWFFAIIGTILLTYSLNFILDIPHYVDYIWAVVIVIITFIGISVKVGFVFLILNSLNILYFTLFNFNTHLSLLKPRTNLQLINDVIEVALALFVFGYLLYKFMEFQRFSEKEISKTYIELKEKNNFISSQNKENIALVKEVHHRVKNNLQIIISLLRLQTYELKSEESVNALNQAINRIMAMSLIHQKLYGNKSLSRINIKEYLNDLIEDIKVVFNEEKPIKININSNFKNVGLKTIVPLGLLVNELTSNTLKYAFKNKSDGEITITIRKKIDDHFEMIFSDNGTWKEKKDNETSFGIELIEILTSQLEGECERFSDESGTTYAFFLTDIDDEDHSSSQNN